MLTPWTRWTPATLSTRTTLLAIALFAASMLVHAACFGGVARPLAAVVLAACALLALACATGRFAAGRELSSASEQLRRDVREELVLAGASVALVALTYARVTASLEPFGDNVRYVTMVERGLSAVSEEPFASRWLTPFLAGDGNITPSAGRNALECLNFAFLAVAFFGTATLASRLARTRAAGAFALVVLATSYFAEYAAWNRLLTDPASYALGAIVALAFVDSNLRLYAGALFLLAVNSEKALVFAPLALFFAPFDLRRVIATLAPVALPIVLRTLRWEHGAPGIYYPERAALFATFPPGRVWFPFFACTVPAYLSAIVGPSRASRMKTSRAPSDEAGSETRPSHESALAILGLAAFLQVAFADDTERMTAYGFVFLVPFAARFFADASAALGRARAFGPLVGVAACVLHRELDSETVRLAAVVLPLPFAALVYRRGRDPNGGRRNEDEATTP